MDATLHLRRNEPVMIGVIDAVTAHRATFKRARPEKGKKQTAFGGP